MKEQTKKTLAVMLSLIMVLTLVPLTSVSIAPKTKLNKKVATIYIGKTIQLKLKNNKGKVK